MADTKISALADVVTLAGGDLFAIDDVSATASKSATATEINTFVRGVAPTIPTAAGTSGQVVQSNGTNLVLSTETHAAPGTAGNILYSDGTNWVTRTNPSSASFNSPAQALGTGDTYVTNSNISVPASTLHRVGMRFDWLLFLAKTAAGTAQAIYQVRFGTAGTTSDTSRISITAQAQTAATANAVMQCSAIITTTGASGKIFFSFTCNNSGAPATGFVSSSNALLSSAFDLTVANSIIGLSFTTGTSAAWTVNNVLTTITY